MLTVTSWLSRVFRINNEMAFYWVVSISWNKVTFVVDNLSQIDFVSLSDADFKCSTYDTLSCNWWNDSIFMHHVHVSLSLFWLLWKPISLHCDFFIFFPHSYDSHSLKMECIDFHVYENIIWGKISTEATCTCISC